MLGAAERWGFLDGHIEVEPPFGHRRPGGDQPLERGAVARGLVDMVGHVGVAGSHNHFDGSGMATVTDILGGEQMRSGDGHGAELVQGHHG